MNNVESKNPEERKPFKMLGGQYTPAINPNALVEWPAGKPPGGVPVKKPNGHQPK